MSKTKSPQAPVQEQRQSNAPKQKLPGGITGRGFLPGKSGNPGGRKRGAVNLTAQLRARLTQEDAVAIVARLIGLAKAGDLAAVKLLLDRLDGPQSGPLAVALASNVQPELDPFEGMSVEQIRNVIAALEQTGGSIRSEAGTSPAKAEDYLKLTPARHAPPPAVEATAPRAPTPAKPTPATPAAKAPATQPAGRTISETDLLGSEAERQDQARIRTEGRSTTPARRGARVLFG